jgi:hypothetical protein
MRLMWEAAAASGWVSACRAAGGTRVVRSGMAEGPLLPACRCARVMRAAVSSCTAMLRTWEEAEWSRLSVSTVDSRDTPITQTATSPRGRG